MTAAHTVTTPVTAGHLTPDTVTLTLPTGVADLLASFLRDAMEVEAATVGHTPDRLAPLAALVTSLDGLTSVTPDTSPCAHLTVAGRTTNPDRYLAVMDPSDPVLASILLVGDRPDAATAASDALDIIKEDFPLLAVNLKNAHMAVHDPDFMVLYQCASDPGCMHPVAAEDGPDNPAAVIVTRVDLGRG